VNSYNWFVVQISPSKGKFETLFTFRTVGTPTGRKRRMRQ